MGGYFETFWSVNPFWTADVNIIGKHPTARGVKPFKIADEWYYHMRFRDGMKGVTPILSAIRRSTRSISTASRPIRAATPMRWPTSWRTSRRCWPGPTTGPTAVAGFGFTGFHVFANLANDNFRTTLLNGIAWVSGLEIPADGVASTRRPKTN